MQIHFFDPANFINMQFFNPANFIDTKIHFFDNANIILGAIANPKREIEEGIITITIIALVVFEYIYTEIERFFNRNQALINGIRTISIQFYHCLINSITELMHDIFVAMHDLNLRRQRAEVVARRFWGF